VGNDDFQKRLCLKQSQQLLGSALTCFILLIDVLPGTSGGIIVRSITTTPKVNKRIHAFQVFTHLSIVPGIILTGWFSFYQESLIFWSSNSTLSPLRKT